jgi:transposase
MENQPSQATEDCVPAEKIMVSCPSEEKAPLLDKESWQSIRWLYLREGKSARWISRQFGISRKTVAKYLKQPDAPKYQQSLARSSPVTGSWYEEINKIIEADKTAPRKQRHTAKRIYERLVETGYNGSARSIRQVVASIKNKPASSASVPLIFEPGKDAQVDFGESYAKIGGKEIKLHGFEMRMNFSRKKFVMFFQSTEKESLLEGHVRAFEYFQGVVERISYDNLSAAVAHVGKGKLRYLTKEFNDLKGYYSFKTNFCRPGKEGAHEKGGVENGVGFARRNWMVPVPEFDSIDDLNTYVLQKCRADDARVVDGQSETIAEAWQKEKPLLLKLPVKPFDPGVQQPGAVDSYCTVSFNNNHYSVPPQYVGKILTIRSYWDHIVVSTGIEKITDHPRSYEKEVYILRPEHYLDLLERRPHAIPYARPLVQYAWPAGYWEFYRKMVASVGPSQAGRDFISILRCHIKYGAQLVSEAIAECSQLNIANADIVIAAIDRKRFKPVPSELMDLSEHPTLINCKVVMYPDLAQYRVLTGGDGHVQSVN